MGGFPRPSAPRLTARPTQECRLNRPSSAAQLQTRIESALTGHPRLGRDRLSAEPSFIVLHYAGPVRYRTAGLVEKNKVSGGTRQCHRRNQTRRRCRTCAEASAVLPARPHVLSGSRVTSRTHLYEVSATPAQPARRQPSPLSRAGSSPHPPPSPAALSFPVGPRPPGADQAPAAVPGPPAQGAVSC